MCVYYTFSMLQWQSKRKAIKIKMLTIYTMPWRKISVLKEIASYQPWNILLSFDENPLMGTLSGEFLTHEQMWSWGPPMSRTYYKGLCLLPRCARKDFRTAVSFSWHNHWLWSLPSEKSGYPEALRWCHKVEQEGKKCRSGGASRAPGARVISAHSFVCPDQGCETEIPATVHGNTPKEPEEKPSSSGIKQMLSMYKPLGSSPDTAGS